MSVRRYFSDLFQVSKSIIIGMGITLRYFFTYKKNTATIQYPHEHDPIPPRHRGIHYLETEKCIMCFQCSDACPVKAIPTGPPSEEIYNRSNIVGVKKWTVDAEPCFRFWANQNSDCSICVRVCPYNRDFSKPAARAWRWLAGTPLRRLALWLVD